VTATEQRFGPHQPLANTHPAVIMELWFSSVTVGGTADTKALA